MTPPHSRTPQVAPPQGRGERRETEDDRRSLSPRRRPAPRVTSLRGCRLLPDGWCGTEPSRFAQFPAPLNTFPAPLNNKEHRP
ncbi:hypothetical protein GCM10010193_00260 [Kitasatospora atroaurantiaca]